MSESHNERIDVPELTADEIQARVLHRDGLMLVIDKPAGLPVHRGPKGGANLESSFDALRFGLPRLPHAFAQQGHARAQFNLGLMYSNGQGVQQLPAFVKDLESHVRTRQARPLDHLQAAAQRSAVERVVVAQRGEEVLGLDSTQRREDEVLEVHRAGNVAETAVCGGDRHERGVELHFAVPEDVPSELAGLTYLVTLGAWIGITLAISLLLVFATTPRLAAASERAAV